MAPRGYIGVVGESHYQEALKSFLATAQPDRIVTVGVEREPDNPFDAKAIRVFDPPTGQTLGYLPRGTTGFVRLLKERGINCHAELTGGTADKPSIGLVLHLHGEQEDQVQWQQLTINEPPTTQYARRSARPAPVPVKSDGGIWSFIRRLFRTRNLER